MASQQIDQAEIQRQLDALKQEYFLSLPAKLEALGEAWADYTRAPSNEAMYEIEAQLHKLAGSSGVFGYPDLGQEAGRLEKLVAQARNDKTIIESNIGDLVLGLGQYVDSAAPASETVNLIGRVVPLSMRPIYIVDDDKDFLEALSLSLSQRGYDVQSFDSIQGLDEAVVKEAPGLVVMDMAFPEGRLAGAEQIQQLAAKEILRVPTVFVSVHEDINARLASVRAGSDAYLVKPIDFDDTCHQIDVLVSRHWQEAYRIMIVDDEVELSNHYGALLQSAGADVSIVNQPLKIMESLIDFRPDVIILDLHMPECSGIELADILRQHDAYKHLPIIFYSSEADYSSQLEARTRGGDDFIMKSSEPHDFVKVVLNRAQRARSMFTMLGTEPMTGLLNQQSFKDELEAQKRLVARANGQSVLVFIDLDNFKVVNDKYGHLIGDAVIKRFAKFLQASLRRSDICSRYGGEEFAVIMPATSIEQAYSKLESIRKEFSGLANGSSEGDFLVTFSAGLTAIDGDVNDVSLLIDSADQALYKAKSAGRNCIITNE